MRFLRHLSKIRNYGHLISKISRIYHMIIIYDSPDVLVLPLWTLLLKEVVHHDAAHAMAHLKQRKYMFRVDLRLFFKIFYVRLSATLPKLLFSLPSHSFPQSATSAFQRIHLEDMIIMHPSCIQRAVS